MSFLHQQLVPFRHPLALTAIILFTACPSYRADADAIVGNSEADSTVFTTTFNRTEHLSPDDQGREDATHRQWTADGSEDRESEPAGDVLNDSTGEDEIAPDTAPDERSSDVPNDTFSDRDSAEIGSDTPDVTSPDSHDSEVEPDSRPSGLDACGNAPGQLFPPGAVWNRRIDGAALDPESAAIINYLQNNHRASQRFQIDWSIHRLEADESVAHRSFSPSGSHYSPDCDLATIPVPEGGAIEGETGYVCHSDGDCHLIVRDLPECRLYEQWRVSITSDRFEGGCQAVWDIGTVPPATGRGDQCTSADAAGLPITPLLFTADEVAAGEIRHALRFILPNANIRNRVYVRPGTHSTGATGGPSTAPPYAARLRLRSDFDMAVFDDKPAAAVVARALQQYGMFLADGGRVTFTGQSDRFSRANWSDLGLQAHDLKVFEWSDFQVVDGGTRFDWTGDCDRTPIVED